MSATGNQRERFFVLCLTICLLPCSLAAQLSYQASRPLKVESPATHKTETPEITRRPRFLGWKHTAGGREIFARCGGSCFPTTPTNAESMAHRFAQKPSPPALSSFGLRPTLPESTVGAGQARNTTLGRQSLQLRSKFACLISSVASARCGGNGCS
jgi:hypothetical protein